MDYIKEIFKKNRTTLILLGVILLVGIFLRTYKFHDWLRFSEDQSRDAGIISAAIENKAPLPLMGPDAGATNFLLGPMYYYLSYVSARIFGNNPTVMAFPSLFFSILAIPLLFLLLREYFEEKMSLALTALMSVSYFLVTSSRFSSNPNLVPFFLLLSLYALLKLLDKTGKRNVLWSITLGIGLGMGIQMHTTFLIIVPIVSFCVFAYMLKKKAPNVWRSFFIIIAIVTVLNVSQIISEVNTHGQNYKNFTAGFATSSKGKGNGNSTISNVIPIAACQVQANAFLLSSLSDDMSCGSVLDAPKGSITDVRLHYFGLAGEIIFSLMGYFLLAYKLKTEKDPKRKNFLALVGVLSLSAFVVFLPIAKIMKIGYFIIVFLVPFVLLGLVLETIRDKYRLVGNIIATAAVAILIILSLNRDYALAVSYTKGQQDNINNSTLGEVEPMSQYILATSKNSSRVYFSGQAKLDVRYAGAVGYFVGEKGIKTVLLETGKKKSEPKAGFPLYYIKNNDSDGIMPGQIINGHEVISGKVFASQTILMLKN